MYTRRKYSEKSVDTYLANKYTWSTYYVPDPMLKIFPRGSD